MTLSRLFFPLLLVTILFLFMISGRGAQAAESPGFPDGPGKDLLMSKCFQCHNEGMWKDQKQDRRGWEGALYRMVGRGALWTEEEINNMAGYLSTVFGPQTNKAPK